jgi:hypothetical protein
MNAPRSGIPLRADRDALFTDSMKSLSRAALSVGLRALSRSQHGAQADRMLAEDRNAELITRASVQPSTLAGNPTLAQISLAFVDALVPVSAAAALINRSLRLQWDNAAEIHVPSLHVPNAAFLGEGVMIPVVNGTSSIDAILKPYKLGVATTLSGEMMRSTNAETMVRAALISNVGPSLDSAMLSAAAGVAGVSPPGILNGVTALTSTAGGGLAAMVADVAALADALKTVAGNGGIVLIAAIKQSVSLAMLAPNGPPFPVLVSSQLAAGTVIAVATQALATIVGAPAIDASGDVLVQEQTTPTGDVMTGSPVRSVFQTDSVSLRFRLPCSWVMRGPGVAVINNTTW